MDKDYTDRIESKDGRDRIKCLWRLTIEEETLIPIRPQGED